MKTIKLFLSLGLIGLIGASLFIYSGIFPIGADTPHSQPVYWVLEQARERSIKRASADINVPSLDDPSLLLSGGADYNDMCSSCHLKPGQLESDMSIGLYPSPPNLALKHTEHDHSDDADAVKRRQYWIIKHGIKASGMPAWGPTHDDERLWAMVAFLQRLPELTPEQYQILTARN
ncbi:MAG: cytochrome C oxidase Cbb3 [Gammaproteobacteria bacterium]|nr:MAG: cytochrome C oxidase Cbb3 [Gammaproteobacteria bacterium]